MPRIDQQSFDKTLEIAKEISSETEDDIAWMLLCSLEQGVKPGDHAKYIALHDLYHEINEGNKTGRRCFWLAILTFLIGVSVVLYLLQH